MPLLIVGLGNPGARYANTRHNIGFMLVDRLAKERGLVWHNRLKGKATYAEKLTQGLTHDDNIRLLKPMSYMNCSGAAFASNLLRNKGMQEILVVHDDLDLALGRVKMKCGGSDGGHKGLRSIDGTIGRNYWRMRIGIGRPLATTAVEDYVLARFSPIDRDIIDGVLERATKNISLLCNDGGLQQDSVTNFVDAVSYTNM